MPHSTIQQRRSALLGFIYAPFRASDLIGAALTDANKQDLDLKVYNSKALMYHNNGVQQVNNSKFQLRQVVTLNVAGEPWQLYFSSNSSLDKTPILVAYGGTIISLLLSGIVWSLASSRRRALLLATSMTAELRQSENQLRDFFDNANDLIQSVAPNGQFVFVNRAWRETLGYSEAEIERLSLVDIILHPDCRDRYLEAFKPVLAGEVSYEVEAIFVTKDSRAITVEGSVNCQIEHGLPKLSRGIFRDITERKQVEKALQQAEEKYRSIFENAIEAFFRRQQMGDT
jgi:PAS domain S-box-containing protein